MLSPKPAFSSVKAPVSHPAPGALTKFFTVLSNQASCDSGLDSAHGTQSMDMSSPLQNLYPDPDLEPVFAHPSTASPDLVP